MQFNAELFRHLSTFSGLATLLTQAGKVQLYPTRALQGAVLPFVVYRRITTDLVYLHGGLANGASDLVQFDCYGSTADSARAVAVQLKDALDAWSSPAVPRAFIKSDQDLHDPDEPKLFRVSVDAAIWNHLTAP